MAANTPILMSNKSQEGIIEFHKQCYQMLGQQWNIREMMREIDLAYMREQDWTAENRAAQYANRAGNSNRMQNVTVPIILPAVEAAVTYQSSVFLTGTPIFGVSSNPATMDAAMQMETVIEDQSVRGKWVQQLMMFFRDGFKYNFSAVEVGWTREVTAAIETDLSFANGKQGRPKEVIWEGNSLKRLDPYNVFFDTRVKPTEIHTKGEFFGYTEIMSRIELKSMFARMPDKMIENVRAAFSSGMNSILTSGGVESYYIPTLNPKAFLESNKIATTNWEAWAGLARKNNNNDIIYKDIYEVTTIYAKILPSDFGIRVPSSDTPQIWKFIIVNHQVVVYAERQTNAHGYLPILVGQPLEDGLGYQTKSLAQNVSDYQSLASSFMNSVVAARRRAISDRGLYDPSRVLAAHINSDNPSAKIPIRPVAYGKPLSEAYYPIPFRDDQSGILMQEIGNLSSMANETTGQNKAKQGQFVKGNKTQREFDTVMGNANGRDQMTAMLYEAQVFTPLKEILKVNILQYQGGVSLFNRTKQQVVEIDPVKLRKTVMEFKVSDGLTPTDKLMDSDSLSVAFQTIASSPQINSQYNVGPLFSYLMKLRGAHITEFEKSPEQITYEQAVSSWQQVIMELAKQGVTPDKYPPQPAPQQFGYNPAASGTSVPSPTPEVRVNNITNNISNNEAT